MATFPGNRGLGLGLGSGYWTGLKLFISLVIIFSFEEIVLATPLFSSLITPIFPYSGISSMLRSINMLISSLGRLPPRNCISNKD